MTPIPKFFDAICDKIIANELNSGKQDNIFTAFITVSDKHKFYRNILLSCFHAD